MLIIWGTKLIIPVQAQLTQLDPWVNFWPRSWSPVEQANAAIPSDWWISFSHPRYGTIWLLKYPEYCRVVQAI